MSQHALTTDGFRRMDEQFIFIAGSTDIAAFRRLAHEAVNRTLGLRGSVGTIKVFSWEVEIGPEGLDQRNTMQKNLPRPADPNCRGLIAFIGERIGLPLENSFELGLIAGIQHWLEPDHRYRLLHPWPDGLDRRLRALDEGFYPLTGTVFEVLDALGTRGTEQETPVYLGLVADQPVAVDGDDISLNGDRYLRQHTAGKNRQERRAWEDTVYEQHRAAVHNFFRAIAKAGLAQNPSRDPDRVDQAVGGFVAEKVLGSSLDLRNPYRFLKFFDIDDGLDFVGRGRSTDRAVWELERRFERRSTEGGAPPLTLRLTGPSGSGKSSTLRAGVLRELAKPKHYGRYRVLAVRPEDFRDIAGEMMPIIPTLLHLIEDETDLRLGRREITKIQRAGAHAAALAVQFLEQHLAETEVVGDASAGRLVLGVDQFEEILDLIADPAAGEDWRPLLNFIEVASQSSRIGVIYTLEESRKEIHRRHLGEAFAHAYPLELDDLSSDFLDEVITKPFGRAGLGLSEEVVRTLLENLNALRPDDEPTAHNTILPLLALKLSHLFEEVSSLYEPRTQASTLEFGDLPRDAGRFGIPPDQLNLGFELLIEHQAEIAWRRSGAALPIKLNDLDHFLQPFVGVSSGKLQLRTVKRDRPYLAERKLVNAFLNARLMVPVGQDSARLVHEAVLRHWPTAWDWVEKRRPYLEIKARVLVDAEAWSLRGRPDVSDFATAENINNVAEILGSYLRAWTLGGPPLREAGAMLRDYCLALFEHSETPAELIPTATENCGNHTNLAATYGLIALLERFRDRDPDCLDRANTTGESGSRPLHQAAWAQEATVEFLLAEGVSATARDRDGEGWPALNGAIQRDELGIFYKLLAAAALESAAESLETALACPDGRTLLHLCADFDRVDMARTLVEVHGFDPAVVGDHQWQPIHHAAAVDAVDSLLFFKSLLPELPTITESGFTCLHIAAFGGAKAVVDQLLSDYRSREIVEARARSERTALHLASDGLQPECVGALLPRLSPNDTDTFEKTPLHIAIKPRIEGSPAGLEDDVLATVEVLLKDPRTDPNLQDRSGRTPLAEAAKLPKVQKRLLDHPELDLTAPIRKGGEPAYALAARIGHWKAFYRFLEKHGPPAEPDLDGRGNSFLHLLAHKRSPLDLLADHSCNSAGEMLNARNKAGQTPLDLAVEHRNWPVLRHLLGLDALDLTPIEDEEQGLLRRLLTAKAPASVLLRTADRRPQLLSQKSRYGWTIWHYACAHQLDHWLDVLAELGHGDASGCQITDAQGRRPIDYLRPSAVQALPSAEWPDPRSWQSDLEWLEVDDRDELCQRLARLEHVPELDGDAEVSAGLELHTTELGFYHHPVRLLRLRGDALGPPPVALFFLQRPEDIAPLRGRSPEIHATNRATVEDQTLLHLSAENVLDYLRFFCFFVRGEEGPFLVLESADQEEVAPDLPATDRQALERLAHPAWLLAEEEDSFFATGLVYYSTGLFGADFRIQRTGMIEMLSDIPLENDLSAGPRVPITGR